jgi:prefoldin beta subunit
MDNKKIQEMQILEQSLQNILLQKQAFQMELSETNSALEELKNSGDEVFKIIGQIMIKTKKDSVKSDLENKKKLINLRLKNLEKQEESFTEQLETLRDEILSKR